MEWWLGWRWPLSLQNLQCLTNFSTGWNILNLKLGSFKLLSGFLVLFIVLVCAISLSYCGSQLTANDNDWIGDEAHPPSWTLIEHISIVPPPFACKLQPSHLSRASEGCEYVCVCVCVCVKNWERSDYWWEIFTVLVQVSISSVGANWFLVWRRWCMHVCLRLFCLGWLLWVLCYFHRCPVCSILDCFAGGERCLYHQVLYLQHCIIYFFCNCLWELTNSFF